METGGLPVGAGLVDALAAVGDDQGVRERIEQGDEQLSGVVPPLRAAAPCICAIQESSVLRRYAATRSSFVRKCAYSVALAMPASAMT
jgi:hypothetical protein